MSQNPCVLWLTGLSGAGKSTIANRVEAELHRRGHHTYLLDGDNVRHGLNRDLGFTDADRVENIRRVAEVAKLMLDAGLIVIVSFISPFRSERQMARGLFDEGQFLEVFVDTPLAVAEERDTKGLYRKARSGELANFTGHRFALRAARGPRDPAGHDRRGGAGQRDASDRGARVPRAGPASLVRAAGRPAGPPSYSAAALMTAIVSPGVTEAPTEIGRSETVPALCATISFSIFIASMTAIRAPSSTAAPASTATRSTVPWIGEASVSPPPPPPPERSLRRAGRLPNPTPPAPPPLTAGAAPAAAGGPITLTSKRLPDTSTV